VRQEVKDLPVRKEFLVQQVLKDLEVHAEKLVLQELQVLKEQLVRQVLLVLPEHRQLSLVHLELRAQLVQLDQLVRKEK
jgi:hypothetical protein